MKDLRLLIWLTQLGLSVAVPLAGFILLAVWLRNQFGLGDWVVLAGASVGIVSAMDSLRTALKAMEQMGKDRRKEDNPPPISFNDHQ